MSYYRIQDYDPQALLGGDVESESYCTGTSRPGVSVCDSVEELAHYFAQAGVPMDPYRSIMVELVGDWTGEDDEDSDLGARLVWPSEIVAAGPIPGEFFIAVEEYLEAV